MLSRLRPSTGLTASRSRITRRCRFTGARNGWPTGASSPPAEGPGPAGGDRPPRRGAGAPGGDQGAHLDHRRLADLPADRGAGPVLHPLVLGEQLTDAAVFYLAGGGQPGRRYSGAGPELAHGPLFGERAQREAEVDVVDLGEELALG